jgi:hypothetical protein
MRNPARDLVESGEDGDRVPDDLGRGRVRVKAGGKRKRETRNA